MLTIAQWNRPTHQLVWTKDRTYLKWFTLSEVEHYLIQIFGGHIKHNNRSHMDGGSGEYEVCQTQWWLLVIQSGS